MDLREKILLDQDMGIGVKYIDYDMQIEYDTLSKEAVKSGMLVETLSEEMRILYVALTRAKEKLIITGISKDSNSEIHNMQNLVDMYSKDGNKINPVLVKKYKKYLDWIMLVYLYEKDRMQDISDLSIINYKDILKDDKEEEKEIDVLKILKEEKASEDDCNKVKNIIEYKYENILATTLPTKTSVTAIKQMKMEKQKESVKENLQEETISFKEPQFVRKNEDIKITSAQKGTLTHLCLQKLDEKKNYNLDMINELINNLCEKEIITKQEADAISAQKILAFTKSNIWKELKEAKEVYKEKPFYINISANEIYDETVDETVLVQGIVDLYFINKNDEIVLVDYKTDYVEQSKEQELVNKYREQLNLYKRALEEALNKKVTNVYIYSTWLNKEIVV
jgi:ATP-dependent helicase/nuclease subunit A